MSGDAVFLPTPTLKALTRAALPMTGTFVLGQRDHRLVINGGI
jgi:hypothetical protein